MDAQEYFDRYRASAADFAFPADASNVVFSDSGASMETCIVDLVGTGEAFNGEFRVFEDGYKAIKIDNDLVNEMIELVRHRDK